MQKPIVEIKNVNKFYGENHVVKDLTMDIYEGEFLSILGPSGCGKTTTLRMIAGFELQSSGVITVEGERVEDKEPYERNVNTVFQSYALFPHMTVYDNIAYGLKMKKVNKAEIKERVRQALSMVCLEGFEKRYPAQMSGGQKQRVAIARAIINRPRVLLLDEPLGALDLKLRKQMQLELKSLQKRLGITFVYVTHDQEEALSMSDRIAIMNKGVLEQIGAAVDIYENPMTQFVANFIGDTNLFEAVIGSPTPLGFNTLRTEAGHVLGMKGDFQELSLVYLSVRPETIKLSKEPVPDFFLEGKVEEIIYIGSTIKCILTLKNGQKIWACTSDKNAVPQLGKSYHIYWDASDAVIINTIDNSFFTQLEYFDLSKYVRTLS